jgi:hypothetical protein
MTDLEKAQHAASVFANYEFHGITVWMIEETQTNYQVFGQPSSLIDLDRISHTLQAEVHCKCRGRYR